MVVLLAGGCSLLPRRPAPVLTGPPTPEALAVLHALDGANAGLRSFKGLGNARVRRDGRAQGVRIAWLAERPDRLRVEILGPHGNPVASLADDGRQLSIRSYADGTLDHVTSSQAGLERLLAVAIRSDEVIALLAGRAPSMPYRTAGLIPGASGGARLRLFDRHGAIVQQVELAADGANPRQVEAYDGNQRLRFTARLEDFQQQGAYRLPRRLTLNAASGAEVTLEIEQQWTDIAIDATRFVLSLPGSGQGQTPARETGR
jgi:hypothetical protein